MDNDILESIRRGNRTSKDIARDIDIPLDRVNSRLASLTKYRMVSRRKYIIRKNGSRPAHYDIGAYKYIYALTEDTPEHDMYIDIE